MTRSPKFTRRGRPTGGRSRSHRSVQQQLESLRAGRDRLALVDVDSGDVRELGGFEDGKNINPQWSGDGRTIYFVSDRMGISNVYRIDAAGGTPAR